MLWSLSLSPLTLTALVNRMWATPTHGVLLHDKTEFKIFWFKTLLKLAMPLKYAGPGSAAFLPWATSIGRCVDQFLHFEIFHVLYLTLKPTILPYVNTMHEQTPGILSQCCCTHSCSWTFWSFSIHKKISQIQAMNIKILIVCRFLLLPDFTTVSSACIIWIHCQSSFRFHSKCTQKYIHKTVPWSIPWDFTSITDCTTG